MFTDGVKDGYWRGSTNKLSAVIEINWTLTSTDEDGRTWKGRNYNDFQGESNSLTGLSWTLLAIGGKKVTNQEALSDVWRNVRGCRRVEGNLLPDSATWGNRPLGGGQG